MAIMSVPICQKHLQKVFYEDQIPLNITNHLLCWWSHGIVLVTSANNYVCVSVCVFEFTCACINKKNKNNNNCIKDALSLLLNVTFLSSVLVRWDCAARCVTVWPRPHRWLPVFLSSGHQPAGHGERVGSQVKLGSTCHGRVFYR